MEYHEELWDTRQDGESDNGHVRGALSVRLSTGV